MRPWTLKARKRIQAQGPCGLCGGPYARHRMIDTQMERVAAGDHIETVAEDYGLTVVRMVTEWCALVDLLDGPPRAPTGTNQAQAKEST
jgi:hypothetical protein